MSGLGSTIAPAGEDGSVHQTSIQSETLPSNDATIVQTTSINTLPQVLNADYIRKGTFTISTSMAAGTIFFAMRIHPNETNYVTGHVAKLFNAWTGGFHLRARITATAFYGGSIRIGRLPPNLTLQQIQSMPVELLTAHPNIDLDPKNTQWIHESYSDQRPVAYHYMTSDFTHPDSFGGWVVGFLAAKLVTQSPEFTTVEMLVETAGNYQFDQLAPTLPVDSGADRHPLGIAAMIPLSLQPLLDDPRSGDDLFIQVFPAEVKKLTNVGISMSAIGLPYAVLEATPGLKSVWVGLEKYARSIRISSCVGEITTNLGSVRYTAKFPHHQVAKKGRFLKMATEPVSGQQYHAATYQGDTRYQDDGEVDMELEEEQMDTSIKTDTLQLATSFVNTPPPYTVAQMESGMTEISPSLESESIVAFGLGYSDIIDVQTEVMKRDLAKWPNNESRGSMSYIYNVRNQAGTPVLTIRLNPNGVFTTYASTAAVVIPLDGATLEFVGQLPVSSPLPPRSLVERNVCNDARAILRSPHGTPKDRFSELMEHVCHY